MSKFKAGDIVQNRNGINKYQILEVHPDGHAYRYKILSHYTHYDKRKHPVQVQYLKDSVHWEEAQVIEDNFEVEV